MQNQNNPPHHSNIFAGIAEEIATSVFQAQGPRSQQQDNLAIFTMNEAMTEERLRALFKKMAEATKDFSAGMGGSTVNLVSISNGKIMAANLGDSLTTLFTRLAHGDDIEARALSTLHTTLNKDEKERVTPFIDPFNLFVENNRIVKVDGDRSRSLAMTRALGNAEFAPMVSQEPSIHTYELDAAAYDYAQIALYTDGMTDTIDNIYFDLAANPEYLALAIQKQMEKSENNITEAAHLIGHYAVKSQLRDNATALSVDLKALPPDQHILLVVLDGHGPKGREITEAAIAALHNTPELQ